LIQGKEVSYEASRAQAMENPVASYASASKAVRGSKAATQFRLGRESRGKAIGQHLSRYADRVPVFMGDGSKVCSLDSAGSKRATSVWYQQFYDLVCDRRPAAPVGDLSGSRCREAQE
jgi:hypothetical protein